MYRYDSFKLMSPHLYDFGVSLINLSLVHIPHNLLLHSLSISSFLMEQPAKQGRALPPREPPAAIRVVEDPTLTFPITVFL